MEYRVIAVDFKSEEGTLVVDEETVAEFASAEEAFEFLDYHRATNDDPNQEVFIEDDYGILAESADFEWILNEEVSG